MIRLLLMLCLLATFYRCGGGRKPPPRPSPLPTVQPTATPTATPTPVPSPIASPSPSPIPSPSASPVPVIPSLSEVVVNTYPGADVGAKLNAASADSGNVILSVTNGGTITTQVRIKSGQWIKFDGRYVIENPTNNARFWTGAIILPDDSGVIGGTLVEPANHGWIVIQSTGSLQTIAGATDAGVTRNITIAGVTFEGANNTPEGGVRSTVNLGNAHNVHVLNSNLNNTSCLGITAGGTALAGNHAEDWVVESTTFRGVASQALNVVNGARIVFRNNKFLDSGKFPGPTGEGMTPIDVEPNTNLDWASHILIEGNLIDSSNSTFLHGNGILVQNTVGVPNYGPIVVRNNVVIGGPFLQNYSGNVASGIFINGRNIEVRGNRVSRVAHMGIRVEGCQGALVEDNELISVGTGGIKALEVINSIDSVIRRNRISIHPNSTLANEEIVESGASDRNLFERNAAVQTITAGKDSRVIE